MLPKKEQTGGRPNPGLHHPGSEQQLRASAEVEKLFLEMVYDASPESKLAAAPTLFDPVSLAERPELPQEY